MTTTDAVQSVETSRRAEPDELRRLDALHRFGVLDTETEPAFDDLARLAAQLCGTPMGSVSLVDADRWWSKAHIGFDDAELPRDVSFCSYALRQPGPLVIADTRSDPRFRDNPLVVGEPFVRFYAGAPLMVDGFTLGTLCVLDVEPRELSALQVEQLETLARQVVNQLQLRREREELAAQIAARSRVEAEQRQIERVVRRSEGRFRALFDQSPVGMAECAADGTVLDVNDELVRMLGYSHDELVGTAPGDLLADPSTVVRQRADIAGLEHGAAYYARRDYRHRDGRIVPTQVGVAAVRDEHGNLSRLLVTTTDISDRVAAEEQLVEAHQELRRRQIFTDAVLDSIDVGIVACDADAELTVFNRTSQMWHGMGTDGADSTDASDEGMAARFDLYDDDGTTLREDRIPLLRALREGSVTGAEIVISPHDRPRTRVQCSGRSMVDADGKLLGAVIAMSDVTATRAQQAALRASEARFRATFDNDPAGLAVLTHGGVVVQANRAFADLVGMPNPHLCGQRELGELLDYTTPEGLADMIERAAAHPDQPFTREQQVVTGTGETIWCLETVMDLPDPQMGRCILLQVQDVTERHEAEARLTHQAMSDSLTDLPNRALLLDHIHSAIARLQRRESGQLFALFCDLDGFKAVNDMHGHHAGDHLLVQIAERLRATVRPADTVARLGGDEFVVLCEEDVSPDHAELVARRILASLQQPVMWHGHALAVTASIGVAHASLTTSPDELLQRADAAMYQAKRLGKNQHVVFDAADTEMVSHALPVHHTS